MAVSRIYINEPDDVPSTPYGKWNRIVGIIKDLTLSVCPAAVVVADNDPSGGTVARTVDIRIGTFQQYLRIYATSGKCHVGVRNVADTGFLSFGQYEAYNASYLTALGSSQALTFSGMSNVPFFAKDFEGDWVYGHYWGSNASFNLFVSGSDVVYSQASSTACSQSLDVTGKKLLQPFRLVGPNSFLTKHKFSQVFRSSLAEGFYSDPNGNKYFVTSNFGGRNIMVSDL